ncbi:MAG: helix-turn-helix domain-containing protein [Pseudomonadota bacterium]
MKWVKENFFNKKYDKEVPQSKSLAPSVEETRSAVCEFYGIDEKELLEYKRGVANEPRKIAIYLARRLSGDSLDEIAKAFNVGAYCSVSSVANRTGSQLQTDSRLKKLYQQIYSSLTMRSR